MTPISTALCALAALATLSALGPDPAPPILPGVERWIAVQPQLPDGLPESFEIALPIRGEVRHVRLGRYSLRGAGFEVLVDAGRGQLEPFEAPPARTYRGSVSGIEGSGAAASLLEDGLRLTIWLDGGETMVLQPVRDFLPASRDATTHALFRVEDTTVPEGHCGTPDVPWTGAADGGLAGTTPGVTEFAAETDYEFFQLNGSSITNTINDIELVMNNADYIYDRDADITYEFTTFIVRSASADPYTSTAIDGRLNEFEANWNNVPESEIQRDVAQMFSGVSFSGGVIGLAPVGVVCLQSYAYSIVESRYTTSLNYRTSLSAHEIGHNWSCLHCDASGTANCHIMCSSNGGCGGISGTNLKLDTVSVGELNSYRNTVGCEPNLPAPLSVPFSESFTAASVSATNWIVNNGAIISAAAQNEPSPLYSLNLDASSANEYGDDEIRSNYLPLNGLSGVTLSYYSQHIGVESGEQLIVEYINSAGDWIGLGTVTSDGVNQTAFVQTTHTLPTAAHHAGFRFRFRVAVDEANDDWYVDEIKVLLGSAPSNDECTAASAIGIGNHAFNTTNATNGSLTIPAACNDGGVTTFVKDVWFLYTAACTGDATVSTCGTASFDTRLAVYAGPSCPLTTTPVIACADNTAGCASGTTTVSFPTTSGTAYFIRVGGVSAGGTGTLTVSCEVGCIADLDGNGVVDGADLGAMLANWGGSGAADLTGNGLIDGADLAILLGAYGPCQ